jgi:hypothetical protein
MKKNKMDELLNKKAIMPVPDLMPDPFLATRIAASAEGSQNRKITSAVPNWSFASIIAACALVLGVYVGNVVFEEDNTQSTKDVFNEYSEAFYQSGLIESWNNSFESGGTNQ